MARFVHLDDQHIVNADAISCIEHEGGRVLKIQFIGRWDYSIILKDIDVTELLKRLEASQADPSN